MDELKSVNLTLRPSDNLPLNLPPELVKDQLEWQAFCDEITSSIAVQEFVRHKIYEKLGPRVLAESWPNLFPNGPEGRTADEMWKIVEHEIMFGKGTNVPKGKFNTPVAK